MKLKISSALAGLVTAAALIAAPSASTASEFGSPCAGNFGIAKPPEAIASRSPERAWERASDQAQARV